MARTKLGALALLLGLGACQYDVDGIYAHVPDASMPGENDAGGEPEVMIDLTTGPLIKAWTGHASVDQDCMACAEQRCTEVERGCREDPECFEYTKCVARAPNPAGQSACRETHAAWVRTGNVRDRDLSGPYGQCVFRDNCAAECEGNSDLACAGGFRWPTTPESSVPLHLYLTDAETPTLFVPNVRVRVCMLEDPTCQTPTSEGVTNAQGLVDLQLPAGRLGVRAFSGYLELTEGGLYPTVLKFSWNISAETTQIVNVVSERLYGLSSLILGNLELDPTRGSLQLRMLGCQGVGVRGVRFDAEPKDARTKSWYVDGLPKLTATETDAVGSGGIVDVLAGNSLVTAVRAADNVELARTNVPIRPNFLTIVVFAPSGL